MARSRSRNSGKRSFIELSSAIGRTAVVQTLEGRVHLAADVIINEIMHHPIDPANPNVVARGQEYIELYNRGDATATMTGWQFTKGIAYSIPAGTQLAPNSYLVVAADLAKFTAKYPGVTNVVGGWVGRLSNSREEIKLVDSQGATVDSVFYADQGDWAQRVRGPVSFGHQGWTWHQGADGDGYSLELVNPSLTNNEGQNWASSTVLHGTPGVANSVQSANIAPMILDLEQTPVIPTHNDAVTVTVKLTDESTSGLSAVLHYRVDAASPPPFSTLAMHDDGLSGDVLANDGKWTATIPAMANNTIVEFYVTASDGTKTRTWPAPTNDAINPQSANLLYQVDDIGYSGGEPMFKLIMTQKEKTELDAIQTAGVPAGEPSNEAFSNAEMNGTLIRVDGTGPLVRYNIGIRNRGQGSRDDKPNNYHLDLPTDRGIDNKTAFNINANYSALEVIGSALHRMAGLPAQNGVSGLVRVNGVNPAASAGIQMYGSYAVLEALNTEFPDNHYPLDSSGNLYAGYNGLEYQGTDPNAYRHTSDVSDAGYEKETNTEDDDWSDLIALTRALDPSQTPDAQYVAAVQQHVDVVEWMRYFALNELLGNHENSLANGTSDDYSIYRGVQDQRFELIVHDLDTILGLGDSPGGENDPIFRAASASLPIISRFMKFPDFAPIYFAQLKELATTVLKPENVDPLIDSYMYNLPASVRQTMKTFLVNRIAHVMTLIPQNLTASSTLTLQNGYPRTTGTTVNLTGQADAIRTKTVLVNGVAAAYVPWQGSWSINNVALRPGINRIVVTSLDAQGKEFARSFYDVWRDTGVMTNVSGTLATGTTTWTAAAGPYHVIANVTVPANATLVIQPGTTVFFDAGTSLNFGSGAAGVADGRLDAQGTEFQRIFFTRTPTAVSNWGGFNFAYTTSKTTPNRADNKLTYSDVEYADSGTRALHINVGKILIDNVRFDHQSKQFLDFVDSSVMMKNSFTSNITNAEPIHFLGFPSDGYAYFEGNTFGSTTGYNDVIDITGGQRPGPIAYFLNNTFMGGADDGIDIDGTDAHVEGNVFMHFHQDSARDSKSHGVTTGTENNLTSEITVVRNIFFDMDHGVLIKDGGFGTIINNTFVNIHKVISDATTSAINLHEVRPPQWQGVGVYVDGNIFQDVSKVFDAAQPFIAGHPELVDVTINRNIFPAGMTLDTAGVVIHTGVGNVFGDPQLMNTTNVTDPRVDFQLRPGPGPAVGTGANGRDMGALVPIGAAISGEPVGTTYRTNATLSVGAPGIYAYKWKLNNGAWSAEIPATNPSGANPTVPPIQLSGLANGTYTVYVVEKNSAGYWQDMATPTASKTWTVNTALPPSLRISEVLASNVTALNNGGTFPDAIELYNDGPTSIDLTGLSITDDPTKPKKYVFPSGTLGVGQYMVLYADNPSAAPGPHLGFSLKNSGEGVYVYDKPANGGALLDSVTFGSQLEDLSISRDGQGVWRLSTPTLGAANAPLAVGDPHQLKINEWLTSGSPPFDEDYIEVYNPSQWPVDLGGLYITDNPDGDPLQYHIPALSFMRAGSYYTFTADGATDQGADHTNFTLAHEQGLLGLFDATGKQIDRVLYGPQSTGISQGRSPDGANPLEFFPTPNPNVTNPHEAPQVITTNYDVLALSTSWKYFQTGVPANDAAARTWKDQFYTDAAWPSGGALLYVESSSLPAPKTTPLTLGRNTYYFRTVFNVPIDPATITELTLKTVLDDGAVIYFNGLEAFRIGIDPNLNPVVDASPANRSVDNATLETWTLPASAIAKLHQGVNSIAIEVHQVTSGSTDIVWGGALTASVTTVINQPPASPLRITEIAYDPPGGGLNLTANDYEFIELHNTSAQALNLNGLHFNGGVNFVFPNAMMAGDAYGVIVKNPAAFTARYGTGINILGTYTESLDDNGELIQIVDANGLNVAKLLYSDQWQPSTDGGGYSLTIIDENAAAGVLSTPGNWKPSRYVLGSPGMADPIGPAESVVVNEVLANSDLGGDWIELKNISGGALDLGGWYLTDSAADSFKFRISAGTVLLDGETLLLTEQADFGDPENPGTVTPFALSDAGQAVYLSASNAPGTLSGYRNRVTFGASDVGVTFGRYVIPSTGQAGFPAMQTPTPGADNSAPLVGPVVISEIHYHPSDGRPEYVELHNNSPDTILLYDPANPANTWRFTDGIDFEFLQGVSIAPFGTIVVASSAPDDFRLEYGLPATVPVYGPFALNLADEGEPVELSKPGVPDPVTGVPYVVVDRIVYDDASPWPTAPGGTGPSLTRLSLTTYGNDPANWSPSGVPGGTPGQAGGTGTPPVVSGMASGSSNLTTPFATSGSFSDPDLGQAWSATINYGDGSASEPLTLNPDHTLSVLRQYSRPGTYTITVTVGDTGGAFGSQSITATVLPVIDDSASDTYTLSLNSGGTIVEITRAGSSSPTYTLPVGASTPLTFAGGTGNILAANDLSAAHLALALNSSASFHLGSSLTLSSLAMSSAETLDLADNDMTITGGNVAAIEALVKAGYAGGAWTGSGIRTSAAGAHTGLAVVPKAGGTLVKFTYHGDINGDGRVNIDDYFKMDLGLANHVAAYASGDINYDGVNNGDDFFLVDTTFLTQGAPLAGGSLAGVPAPLPQAPLQGSGVGLSPAAGDEEPADLFNFDSQPDDLLA